MQDYNVLLPTSEWKNLTRDFIVIFYTFCFILLEIGLFLSESLYATPSTQNNSADAIREQQNLLQQQQQEPSNPVLVTGITQNLLTVVSFLIGTASFILGLSIQNVSRLTVIMSSYFRMMILALLIPAIIIISYGAIVTLYTVDPGDEHYLLLLFALYVPSGIILNLIRKLHPTTAIN